MNASNTATPETLPKIRQGQSQDVGNPAGSSRRQEMSFPLPRLRCSCDAERFALGWKSAGCRIHGLARPAQGWVKA